MSRIVGRIVNGKYVQVDEPVEREKFERGDYFKGFAPSHLGRLSNAALHAAAARIYDQLSADSGTPKEKAFAAEAYAEIARETRRRSRTLGHK